MSLIMNRDQLCEALGVSDSAITAWEKKGMPTVRKGRGRGMRSLYDFDAVAAWQRETGYGHGVQALTARFLRTEPDPPPVPVPAAAPPAPDEDEDAREALAFRAAAESALLALPAALARAGLEHDAIEHVLEEIFNAMRAELAARGDATESANLLRAMVAIELASPGTWTR